MPLWILSQAWSKNENKSAGDEGTNNPTPESEATTPEYNEISLMIIKHIYI